MIGHTLFLFASLQIASLSLVAAQETWCGKLGWDAGYESFASFDAGSYAGCAAKCSQFKQCKSFAYSSDDCEIYDKVVKGNFVADSGSSYTFYDAACKKAGTTTTTITTTSAKTTTTTTKAPARTTFTTTTSVKSTSKASTTTKTTTTTAKPTTTRNYTTTTTTKPKATSTGDAICDKLGFFVGPDEDTVFIENTWGRLPKSTTTKLHCYNNCVGFNGCLSYAYNEGSCTLFNVTLARNFQQDSSSVAEFYDLACGAPPATADDADTGANRRFQIRR